MRNIPLKENEQILHVEHESLLPQLPWLCLGVVLTIAPFFFFFPFLAFGYAGLIPLVFFVGLGMSFIVRTTIRWRGTICVLTNERIYALRQLGPIDRRVNSAPLHTIQDVAHRRQGFLKPLLSLGSVRVLFRGVVPSMYFERIRRPEVLHAIIEELTGATRNAPSLKRTTFERVHLDPPTS
ncbi:TPA: hypothetical protein DEB00_02945 [Candidatus Uhrbacteria bacterium]|nr:hypothetical protein [Candidatus Uhrbacteria bacterium]